jgi:hypothetical protein
VEPPRRQEPLVPREELHAAIEARRDLPELEEQLVDGFVERIEQRIDARIDARLRTRERPRRAEDRRLGLALVSLGVSIPLTAIAVGTAGLVGLIVVWTAIVVVNALYIRG